MRKHQYPKTRDEIRENAWEEVTRERYWEMLEILPPAKMVRSGGFAVGEALCQLDNDYRDDAKTVFNCFLKVNGRYFEKPNTLDRLDDVGALRREVKAQYGMA